MDYLLIFQYLPGNQWIYHWSLAKQQERAADGWERPGRGHTSIAPRTDGSKVVSVRELNKTAENGSGTDDLPIFTYYNCINGDFSIDTSYRVTESNHVFFAILGCISRPCWQLNPTFPTHRTSSSGNELQPALALSQLFRSSHMRVLKLRKISGFPNKQLLLAVWYPSVNLKITGNYGCSSPKNMTQLASIHSQAPLDWKKCQPHNVNQFSANTGEHLSHCFYGKIMCYMAVIAYHSYFFKRAV